MDAESLLANFETLSEAPEGVDRWRRLVLDLAVRGMLVPQDRSDEPAHELLDRVAAEKQQLVTRGVVPRPRTLNDNGCVTLRRFPIPESWVWTRLEDVSSYIQRGKSPRYADTSGVSVVSQKCVQWSGFDMSRARFVDEGTLPSYGHERFLQSGDVLWNSTGTGTVGRVAVFPESGGYARAVADSHVTVVRVAICVPQYVYWWLASHHVQETIDDITSGTTNQKELNTTTVRVQPIPIPPLAEQSRIVARVDELMQLCDDLEARQQTRTTSSTRFRASALDALVHAETEADLATAWTRVQDYWDTITDHVDGVDDVRQTILELAVRGRLSEPRADDIPVGDRLAQVVEQKQQSQRAGRRGKGGPLVVVDDPLWDLPSSWRWVPLDDAALDMMYGSSAKSRTAGEVPVLRMGNLQSGEIDWSDLKFTSDPDEVVKYRLPDRAVLFNRTNSPGTGRKDCDLPWQQRSDLRRVSDLGSRLVRVGRRVPQRGSELTDGPSVV